MANQDTIVPCYEEFSDRDPRQRRLSELTDEETAELYDRFSHLLIRDKDDLIIAGCLNGNIVQMEQQLLDNESRILEEGFTYTFRAGPAANVTFVEAIENSRSEQDLARGNSSER